MWNNSISVNVRKIDEQHQKLISLLNQIYDAMSIGQGKIILDNILKELVDYTEYHFSTEESYMTQFDYPEYTVHKSEHDFFKNKISDYMRTRTIKMDLISELLDFLKNWLINHIKKSDKKYSAFFNEHGLV